MWTQTAVLTRPEGKELENYDEWREATRNAETVRAMVEDYRVGPTVDCVHEEADRAAGRKVQIPMLVLWSTRDDLEELYGDPVAIWENLALDVRGHRIESGRHMVEESPDELALALQNIFAPR